jgi:uncharacterized protein YcbK (DUF882 family)
MDISEHLSLDEFQHSDTAIAHNLDNTMPDELMGNAQALGSKLFEPVRALLGVPLKVDSGYRSPELNQLVRGVPTSQHTKGQAVDFIPQGMALADAFEKIVGSGLIWDQLICEHDGAGHMWIHMSYAVARNRQEIIRNLLKA